MKRYSWQPATSEIPTNPGVYRFVSTTPDGDVVLYVGKAKNLRSRLTSYFQAPDQLLPRTVSMLQQAESVIWTVVKTEIEALQLEHNLIQQYKPRYNIRFRDDKSYPYIAISSGDPVPRLFSTRKKTKSDTRFFGPYPNPGEARTAIDSLLRVYPVRTCSAGVFKTHQKSARACLLGHIGKCIAPCLSKEIAVDHRELVHSLIKFLDGGDGELLRELDERMQNASKNLKYEEAAKYRDQYNAIDSVLQKSSVSVERDLSADFVGVANSEVDLIISLIQVRNGRVTSEERVLADLYAANEASDLVVEFIINHYADQENPQRQIFITGIELDTEMVSSALSVISGRKILVSIPQRGEKARIGNLAMTNAATALQMLKKRVLADLNSRSQALEHIAAALNLYQAPLRIECVDVSHLQGTNRVAAVVVFEDGLPARSEYRSYVLQNPGDDLAGITEVIERRVERFKKSGGKYPVGLLVIDGGPWQARAAKDVLERNKIDIPVVGLAKRLEELWLPAASSPIMLPRDSQALYLMQQIRDETHRRAISHHRNRRSKRATASVLDEIEGIGPERRKMLLKKFGGAAGLRKASISDLASIKGITEKLATQIHQSFHTETEILEQSEHGE